MGDAPVTGVVGWEDRPPGRRARLATVGDRLQRAFDWFFRDRTSGAVVIAQLPNLPLALFLVAATVRRFVRPQGLAGTVVSVAATGALLWWAADEILRGVNPFRRLLGAAVAAVTLVGLALTV